MSIKYRAIRRNPDIYLCGYCEREITEDEVYFWTEFTPMLCVYCKQKQLDDFAERMGKRLEHPQFYGLPSITTASDGANNEGS